MLQTPPYPLTFMEQFVKGMDISTLLEVERLGGKFYNDGVEMELLSILESYKS
mgnify:CR=1 FL=1